MLRSFRAAVSAAGRRPTGFLKRVMLSSTVKEGTPADVILSGCPVGPFQMNMFLVGCKESKKAALIDSGATAHEMQHFQDVLEEHSLELTHLLQTHAHIDHVRGLSVSRELFPDAPIYLHKNDMPVYDDAANRAAEYGISLPGPLPRDNIVHMDDGDVISVGTTVDLRVLFTPGHCPGHVCFLDEAHGYMFGGDLIFQGSIGRTDLPLCNDKDMQESLRRVAKDVPPRTLILPGHMNTTTMEQELASNPFLQRL